MGGIIYEYDLMMLLLRLMVTFCLWLVGFGVVRAWCLGFVVGCHASISGSYFVGFDTICA